MRSGAARLEGGEVHVGPLGHPAGEEKAEPPPLRPHPLVLADQVARVLAVADEGLGVVDHRPPRPADELVGPPVVGDDGDVGHGLEEALGGGVEEHGVAAGNALDEGVLEGGRQAELRRQPEGRARLVDEPGAPADEGRAIGGQAADPGEAAGEPVLVPEVVLVGEGVEVGTDRRSRWRGRGSSRRSPARTLADLDPAGAHSGGEVGEDRPGLVGRAVVADDEAPVAVTLGGDGRELGREEARPVAGAHQDGDVLRPGEHPQRSSSRLLWRRSR